MGSEKNTSYHHNPIYEKLFFKMKVVLKSTVLLPVITKICKVISYFKVVNEKVKDNHKL